MALSTWKLSVAQPPPAAGGEHRVRRPVLIATSNRALNLQEKIENDQNSQSSKALSVSRRDLILSLTAASLAGVTLFSTEQVEARPRKSENRKKVMEKLKKLRDKAGDSMSKTGEAEKEPLSQPLVKEKKKLPSPLSPPSPYPPHKSSHGPLVDAALP